MEESGAHLQADGEYEQDESEIFDEGENQRVDPESQVSKQDSDEQDPGGSDGDSLDFETAEIQACRYDDSQDENSSRSVAIRKQIQHIGRKGSEKKPSRQQAFSFFLSCTFCTFNCI